MYSSSSSFAEYIYTGNQFRLQFHMDISVNKPYLVLTGPPIAVRKD